MIFAHIFLPASLFAICKAQPYHENSQQSVTINNERPSVDDYRNLIVNSVVKMKDSCRLYDYLLYIDKKWTDDDEKLEVAPYGGREIIRNNRDFCIHTLLRILNEYSNDTKLESQLTTFLQAKCCRDSVDTPNCLEKREPRTVTKVKFHSWGGKRNGSDNVPKIVLRTPFRPWGGKRSQSLGMEDDEWTKANR